MILFRVVIQHVRGGEMKPGWEFRTGHPKVCLWCTDCFELRVVLASGRRDFSFSL